MMLTARLLTVCSAYCEATSRSRSRISTIIFGDGMRLDGIAAGKDLRTRSFEKAMLWFSANWPADAKWPADVERPTGVERPALAQAAEAEVAP